MFMAFSYPNIVRSWKRVPVNNAIVIGINHVAFSTFTNSIGRCNTELVDFKGNS